MPSRIIQQQQHYPTRKQAVSPPIRFDNMNTHRIKANESKPIFGRSSIGQLVRSRRKLPWKSLALLSPVGSSSLRKRNIATTKAKNDKASLNQVVTEILADNDGHDILATSETPKPVVLVPTIAVSSEQEQQERKVRFDLSRTTVIDATCPIGGNGRELTEQEISDCWWNPQERFECMESFRQEIRSYYEEHEVDSIRSLLHVVRACNESSTDVLENDMAAAIAMFPPTARCMESELIPLLKTFRRRHSDAVLDYYHNKIPSHFNDDLKDRMLSARSIQYSRSFKILSHMQGEVDALVAAAAAAANSD